MKLYEIAEEDLPIVYDMLRAALRAGTQVIVYSSATGKSVRCWPLKSCEYDPRKNIINLSFTWGGSTPMVIPFSMSEVDKWKLSKGDGEYILRVGLEREKPAKKSRKVKEAIEDPDAPIIWDIINNYLETGKDVWAVEHTDKHEDAGKVVSTSIEHGGSETIYTLNLAIWHHDMRQVAGIATWTIHLTEKMLREIKTIRQDGHTLLAIPFSWYKIHRKFDPAGWTWQVDHWEHDNPKDQPPPSIKVNKLFARGKTIMIRGGGAGGLTYKVTSQQGMPPVDIFSNGDGLVTCVAVNSGKPSRKILRLEPSKDALAKSKLKQLDAKNWEWDL